MKIAYLILAYKNPQQLLRLIKTLETKDTGFFIHIDKKSNISDFRNVLPGDLLQKIHFVKREVCYWGYGGIVKATLQGLRDIIKKNDYDYVFLLSGQCYPIKDNQFIAHFLEQNAGKIFMECFSLPYSGWIDNGGFYRLDRYYFKFFSRDFVSPPLKKPKALKRKILHKLFKFYFDLPRSFPKYLKPFGGSTWWCIPSKAARYILDFMREHPDYLSYYRHVYIPDETFFQTILWNSKDKDILENLVPTNLHYIYWLHKLNAACPKILTRDDYAVIQNSDKLFARKFDINIDSNIFDMFDAANSQTAWL